MSKKFDIRLTMTELKMILSALEMGTGDLGYVNLKLKIEDHIEMNEEPEEIKLTWKEWYEKNKADDDE